MKFYQRVISCVVFVTLILLAYYHFRIDNEHELYIPIKTEDKSDKIFVSKNDKCVLNYTLETKASHHFQRIDNTKPLSKGYVYSAYYDNRRTKSIVVIALLENNARNLHCVVWFSSNFSRTVQGNVIFIPEGSNRRYTGSIINCPIGFSELPKYVSIIENKCDQIRNMIKVEIFGKINATRTFSVCVTPFNLNYNNIDQFLEMISINKLMGASHFYFYNYSTGINIDKILEKLINKKSVTVLPWQLPMKVHIWPIPSGYQEEIKYFGQMAMLNDCLYRNMGYYKYVVFSDLDEYLIPRQHRNWKELFDEIIDKKYAQAKGWMFRNVFFKTEWPSDREMERNKTITDLKVMSLLKVQRERMIYAPNIRSKLILDPLAVDVVGVHNVWSFQPGASVAVLNPDEGLCHHYRFWDGLGEKEFVIDRNIFRLREDLVRIFQKHRKIYT